MTSTDSLFRPFTHRGLTLPNRIVMAPMTRARAPEGQPGQPQEDYYRRRAEGGVGLILSEGTVIARPTARNLAGIPFFHGTALEGWQGVIAAVHQAGGKMGPQIWHTGSTRAGWEPPLPVESPSGLVGPDDPRGLAMTEADIADTIAAFASAAADAKRLGFDVVELHGAHGYLIDEFFWSGTNHRHDRWGGATLRERSRFAVEVIKATRAAIGPDFPLILRVSQFKPQDYAAKLATTPAEMTDWLLPLVEAGVDILHCSQRRFWDAEFPALDGDKGLNFAGWAKRLTGAPTISVGSVGLSGDMSSAFAGKNSDVVALDALTRRMEAEEFDLIAVGRALLSDPLWVQKLQRGADDELQGFAAADLAAYV